MFVHNKFIDVWIRFFGDNSGKLVIINIQNNFLEFCWFSKDHHPKKTQLWTFTTIFLPTYTRVKCCWKYSHWGRISEISFIMKKNSYLREAWNVMDFFIVFFGIISSYLNSTNLKALRAFRVLRPLRTISKVKSLKIMINTLLKSIVLLKDSMIIILFYYTLFAIMGS